MAKSLRAAINAKCKECIYDPNSGGGTWRQQIGACTSPKCPLFEVRPMPSGGGAVDKPVAVKKTAKSVITQIIYR